jgi:peptidoglycan hydrolase-like protein with peptidoglycan-binding domain
MPAGETDRSKAVAIALTDIAVGDGVYVKGYVAEDRKSIPAQKVTIVSQSDIAKRQEKERAEWRQRGINGIIASLNPQTKEITITTRTAAGPTPVIIPVTDKVKLRRYAPDSIKFSDAKKSSWEELKVGDQLRAKGDKSADGTHFTAEEIVTGSFRTIGGEIKSVDAATGEIKISDIQNQQPLTVAVRKDSTLKRIPPEALQMMAAGGPPGGAKPPATPPPTANPQGGASAAGMGGFDIQKMIDMLPATTLNELKPGDMILLLGAAGTDPSRVTAVTLVSGVGPIFTMLQAQQRTANRPPNLGTINIGIGGP